MSNVHELPRRALDLSWAIYRVTAQFPNGEALIGQMRQLSGEIAAELSLATVELSSTGDMGDIKKDINRLRIYFAIAKEQNWVKPINWSILDFEYYKLQQEADFEYRGLTRTGSIADLRGDGKDEPTEREISFTSHNIREVKMKAKQSKDEDDGRLLARQEKLLKTIQNSGLIKMSGLVPLLRDVASERTIRNDLRELLGRNLIKKDGSNKGAKYSIG